MNPECSRGDLASVKTWNGQNISSASFVVLLPLARISFETNAGQISLFFFIFFFFGLWSLGVEHGFLSWATGRSF